MEKLGAFNNRFGGRAHQGRRVRASVFEATGALILYLCLPMTNGSHQEAV